MALSNARNSFGFSTDGGSNYAPFASVFMDAAQQERPQVMRDVFRLAHFLATNHGTLWTAYQRILSYFITDIEVSNVGNETGEDEKEKWEEFLREDFHIYEVLQAVFSDRFAVGNSLSSLLVPFERWLVCNRCHRHSAPLRVVADPANQSTYEYAWQIPNFVARCPVCREKSAWDIDDRIDTDEKRLKLKRWDVQEFDPLHDPYTDEVHWVWRIPEDYKRLLRQGHLFQVERAPKPVLEAVAKNWNYRFHKDALFFMGEPNLATDKNRGWSMPRSHRHHSEIWEERALHRQNQTISADYVTPMRVLTPQARQGSGAASGLTIDPMHTINLGDLAYQVRAMIRRWRRDPASMHFLPFPVEYQTLGGDASKFAPVDLLNQSIERLLNDVGTPVELYKGTLQLQVAPVALRLFESQWSHLYRAGNRFLAWLVKQICDHLNWERCRVTLKRVTVADDILLKQMILQLFMGQQVSGQSALKMVDLDWKAEQKRIAEETRQMAEIKAQLEKTMAQAGFASAVAQGIPPEQAAGGGQPAEGGAAPAGGQPGAMPLMGMPVTTYLQTHAPGTPVTPDQQLQDAQSLAQELLGIPESMRRSQLAKLRQSDPNMHAVVTQQIDQTRSEVRTAAGTQAMMSQFGQA